MNPGLRLARIRFSTMGCPAELCVYASSRPAALQAFSIAQRETQRLDEKYSHYRPDSYLSRLQHRAGQPEGCEVDTETAALLDFAQCQFQHSNGRFDITAGLLTRLWQHAFNLPTEGELQQALIHTGWNRVDWSGTNLKMPPGMQLDLGGIVKEYAADRVALLLRRAGYSSGYIDLGGDLHILGPHPDGSPWRVGIRHPRPTEASAAASGNILTCALAAIDVHRGGIASSGDYERYRIINGERYGHIIDARTGWPARGLASVSVLAPTCLVAGAVSTHAMLLGQDEALAFLETSGLRWLAYAKEKERPPRVAFLSSWASLPIRAHRLPGGSG